MNALSPPFLFFSDSSLLQDNVAFVLCLDTVGNGDSLHLHVSKPPKEGSPQYSLLKELEMVRTGDHHCVCACVCVSSKDRYKNLNAVQQILVLIFQLIWWLAEANAPRCSGHRVSSH